jgi:acid phosphatase type 7
MITENNYMLMKKMTVFLILAMVCFNGYLKAQNYSSPIVNGAEKFVNKPKLIRGPYLQAATDTSMVIRWRTDVATRSRVAYGKNLNELNHKADQLDLVTEHEIKLVNLKPDTKYYYSVGSLNDTLQIGKTNYFNTLPKPGLAGNYRVGIFGDCGALTVNQARVRDQFVNYLGGKDLNAWVLLGDNAYNDGTDVEFQAKFFNVYKDKLLKNYPVYPSPGNHDYHDVDFGADFAQNNHNTAYYKNFTMPINGEAGGVASKNPAFYSFDVGNIHFISLDSYGKEDRKYFLYDTISPQVKWVKQDLAANKNKDWVVAFWHYPPYSKGTHDSDTDGMMSKLRENFIGILEQAGVDLIICGHSHVYERSKLMNGHYGHSSTFDEKKHNLSNSSALNDGSVNAKPYHKKIGEKGTVYVVSGSASYVGKPEPDFPHKAMYYSNATDAGAAILEVNGSQLEFKWICADGIIRDRFTMVKNR